MAGAEVHTWQIGELAIARESTTEAQVVARRPRPCAPQYDGNELVF